MADDNAYHAQQDQLLQDDINAAKVGTIEYQKALDAKKLADLQFFNQHKALEDQMVNQAKADAERIKASWHATIDPMVQTTGTQIKGLIEGTETWGQALANIGEQALSVVINAIEKMVESWIVNMITGQAATQTSALSQVASYAGLAGAGGVASMAAAPFPLDLGAPAFGASMAEAAMAFGSFDKGVNVMPHDAIVQVHRGERIMPDGDNRAIMAAVGARAGGAGGVTNITHAPVFHGVGDDVRGAAQESNRQFTKRVEKMRRRGLIK